MAGYGTHPTPQEGPSFDIQMDTMFCMSLYYLRKEDRACEYYVKGIETDGLAEEFYRRLIACHLRLGNNAEAVTIYNLCRR